MAEWKKICCAIDFSQPSRLAMTEACDLAQRLQAELTLVHVAEAPAPAPGEMVVSPPELFERLVREMERKMSSWRSEAERVVKRPIKSVVLTGHSPSAEILRFVREGFFDLVVMATRGHTGLKRLVLGSVTERVVREAECSVLVVRRPFEVEAD